MQVGRQDSGNIPVSWPADMRSAGRLQLGVLVGRIAQTGGYIKRTAAPSHLVEGIGMRPCTHLSCHS